METDSFYSLSIGLLLGDITVYPLDPTVITGMIVMILLLFCSAMISGSEVAFFSLSPSDKFALANYKSKASGMVAGLLDIPERLLATILIANNLINIGIVLLSTYITNSIFDFSQNLAVGFVFQVVAVTFLILIFGEILPKVYATSSAKRFALFIAPVLYVLDKIFWFIQFSKILIISTSLVNKRIHPDNKNISMDELSEALELTKDDIETDKNILEGIVNFGNIMVRDIMRSRVDVTAIDESVPFSELKSIIVESGYSRIPVFKDSFDEVKGILYIKDLLPYLNEQESFSWQNLVREAHYVPESKKINVLLKEFQANKKHMAVVVDEYGGSSGIITLEDILEEIVGEISDESDGEESFHRKINDRNYIFEGKILLNDFYKILEFDSDIFDEIKGDAETLAGLILEINREIPIKNQQITYKKFHFIILAVDERRIKRIHLRIS